MIQPALIPDDIDDQIRSFLIFALISFLSHLIIFALIAFVHLPTSFERRIEPPPSIDVDLLAFNPETPLPPAKVENSVVEPPVPLAPPIAPIDPVDQLIDKIAKMPAPSQPETLPVKKGLQKKKNPADYVVEKPKKNQETKKPLKKKEIDTDQVISDAVKRMEKQTEASHPKSVSDRIERLKKEVQNQPSKPTKASTASASASSGNAYPKDFSQIEIFQAEVSVRMKNNWVFSEKLAGQTKGLESRLVIKVLPNGEITDVWFEKRSGNEYLDNSAYKTVMKSNPLPPLPAGFSYYHLVLGFTPSGLH
jgi:TonB family protein